MNSFKKFLTYFMCFLTLCGGTVFILQPLNVNAATKSGGTVIEKINTKDPLGNNLARTFTFQYIDGSSVKRTDFKSEAVISLNITLRDYISSDYISSMATVFKKGYPASTHTAWCDIYGQSGHSN